MSKLYYDNAIDALFMAEKHGVCIIDDKGREYFLDDFHYCLQEACSDKFYIAPESLEIFEPREGDLCKYANIMEEIKYSVVMEGEGQQKKKHFDCFEIIQRSGIPFIMPSKEEITNDKK